MFKKHIKNSASLKTKTARFSFNGKEFLPFTDRILTIGSNIEAFLFDEYYYILNRDRFNAMFDYKDAFLNVVEENEKAIVDTNMISNAPEILNLLMDHYVISALTEHRVPAFLMR